MPSNPTVAVFGAYGHTGRFVVSEVRRRGWTPVLAGRDAEKLAELPATNTDLEPRPASIDDPASLDRALTGAAAVINCAGPFASTATAVIDAALRARIHYLDVAAEVEVALSTIDRYAELAPAAGIAIVPSAAFYGGLAVQADFTTADSVTVPHHLKVSEISRRAVNAPHLVALVRAGARFERGVLAERPEAAAA
jgi:saccharopine dehydrogenase-like NADP-dependent oxidoreductase